MSDLDRLHPTLTRRDALRALGLAAGASWAALLTGCGEDAPAGPATGSGATGASATRARGELLACGWSKTAEGRDIFSFASLDLDRPKNSPRPIELGFYPHGIAIDPLDPNRIAIFEKRGKGACVVDLAEGRVVRPLTTSADRQFYGHGVFSTDGRILFCTETDVENGYRGLVAMRDAKTLEPMGEFESHGSEPHDLLLVQGGRVLAITNGGDAPDGTRPPSVTFVDVEKGTLLEDLRFTDPEINAGHLAMTSDGDLAVVSAPRPGTFEDVHTASSGISFRPKGGELRTVVNPRTIAPRMVGESLSVAIDAATGTVGVTNPDGDIVTFWDLAEGHLKGTLDVENPRGIALTANGAHFVVAHDGGTRLSYVGSRDLALAGVQTLPLPWAKGSHIVIRA
ncbi:MAG: DUF1513 domain-containing protein [Planctomycetota bacterium]